MRFRIPLALTIAAAALGASAQPGVTRLGQQATCRAAAVAQNVRDLGGFELLFSTVLTRVEPGLRQSALLALRPAAVPSLRSCKLQMTPARYSCRHARLRARSLV